MCLKKVFIICNPNAGKNSGYGVIDKLTDEFEKKEYITSCFITKCKEDIEKIVFDAYNEEIALLVVVGGDGTINEVVNYLMDDFKKSKADGEEKQIPLLAFFPAGTANLVALELGMSQNVSDFVEACCDNKCRMIIWPACIGNKYFVAVAGVGFDAYIISKVSYAVKKRFSKAAYAIQTFKFLSGKWRYIYKINIDGVEYRAVSAIVANSKYYAGPYVVKEEASIKKQNFFVCLFEKGEKRFFLLYFMYLLCGKLEKCRGVKIIQGKEIEITGIGQKGVQVDGDVLMELPVIVRQGEIPVNVVGLNI